MLSTWIGCVRRGYAGGSRVSPAEGTKLELVCEPMRVMPRPSGALVESYWVDFAPWWWDKAAEGRQGDCRLGRLLVLMEKISVVNSKAEEERLEAGKMIVTNGCLGGKGLSSGSYGKSSATLLQSASRSGSYEV